MRPILEAGDTEDNTLLLTDLGRPFTPDQMTAKRAPLRGRRERRQAWRVSFMAAHGGDGAARRRADIRFIQVFLAMPACKRRRFTRR